MPKSALIPCTKEEMDKLIEVSMVDDFAYMLFTVARKTGRRLGEYYDVQVKDIDYERKVMMTKVLKRRQKFYKEALLTDDLIHLIKVYILKNKLKLDDYLFRKVSYRQIQNMVVKYGKKANIPHKVSFHCVSEDTECLTKNGWKKYDDLKIGDKIFSYNIQKDIIEEDNINDIISYENKDKVYHIKNRYMDSIISELHNMVLNISHIKTLNKIRVSSVWDGWKLISMKDFDKMKNKRVVLHKLSGIKEKGSRSIGKYNAGILGWILSDGCISKKDVTIFQSLSANEEKCKIIEDLLNKSKLKYNIKIQKKRQTEFGESQMVVYRLLDKDWIYDFIDEERNPKNEIFNLNAEELEEIYKMMMLGDGCRDREYCSQNIKRIEFLQILSIFINKRCLISKGKHNQTGKDKHRTWFTESDYVQILPEHIKEMNYNKKMWCPTTRNGTWIARRNNKTFITGNCFRHFFITHLSKKGYSHSDIAKLTGHSTIGVIASYDHTIASDIRERAIKDIEDI